MRPLQRVSRDVLRVLRLKVGKGQQRGAHKADFGMMADKVLEVADLSVRG